MGAGACSGPSPPCATTSVFGGLCFSTYGEPVVSEIMERIGVHPMDPSTEPAQDAFTSARYGTAAEYDDDTLDLAAITLELMLSNPDVFLGATSIPS